MSYPDLRAFLARLEEMGELARVEVEVESEFEVAAICRKVLNDGGPALLFERVRGCTMPLAVNLFATRRRYAAALETTPDELTATLIDRMERLVPAVVRESGSCQDHVILGDDVDLYKLPIPVWSEKDGGPFLTLPCNISKDPETGIRNVGIYRSQVFDRRTIGIHGVSFRHLFQHWNRAGRDKPFPLAIAMGCDPTIHIASATPLPFNTDEMALAGALRGEPVELVPCKTVPVEVPASAEIVLEGYILPETRKEGPFGDYLGYYDPGGESPIMTVTAITHRERPIMLASFEGRPPHDNATLNAVMYEAELMRAVSLPGLKRVHMTEAAAGFNCVAAVDKPSEGYARMMALAMLGTWAGRHVKTLIMIDADLDPSNPADVEWALATRFQPERDIEILHNLIGSPLDPSRGEADHAGPRASLTSKVVLDATRPLGTGGKAECWPHREVWQRVLQEWQKYGLPDPGK